jgi:hypothetical protein
MDQGLKQAKVMVKEWAWSKQAIRGLIDSGLQITLIRDITTIHIMGVVLRNVVFKILLNRLFKKVFDQLEKLLIFKLTIKVISTISALIVDITNSKII